MTHALALVRVLPLAFMGRLGIAFVEVTLAAVVISGSVVLGHDLKAWRAWYWDPSTLRYWAPTAAPSTTPSPMPAAAAYHVPPQTATPPCHTSVGAEELAFARSNMLGNQCVWLMHQSDGTHVLVAVNGFATRDMGVIGTQRDIPLVRVYSPQTWAEPVLVVTGSAGVLVFSWQNRGVVELLRAGGERVDLAVDGTGWPRVSVTSQGATRSYRWLGTAFDLYP